MMHAKTLCLLAVAATALTAFAGSASAAPTLTSPSGTGYFGLLHANGAGHVVLDNPIAKIECSSTIGGAVEGNGTAVAFSNLATLSFGPCTNSWHVTVVAAGTLYVHNGTGTVVSSGATVEATRLGVTCRYSTSATDVGVLTDSTDTGGGAEFDIQAAIPFHSGSGLCGSGATTWTGAYAVAQPKTLHID